MFVEWCVRVVSELCLFGFMSDIVELVVLG